ncbi:MAG: hypothetical protein LBK74_10955 [Treponema sp.]|nr:hypothetical protein [Treponema sp.]
MKGLTKGLLFCFLGICVAAAVFAACRNPWIPSLDKDKGGGLEDGGLPALTGAVSITGTPDVGETLTADTTSLGGSGAIGYRWGRGDAPAGPFTDIASATAAAYILTAADNGKYIVVTVTRAGYSGSAGSGSGLGPVGLPALAGTVSITQTGQTLTADTTSLGGSGTIGYQWKRGTSSPLRT